MTDHTVNVAALIGSRICHDLISPVGAVTNGLELLAMSGVADSPELTLVNESAADASARIRLFRLAFGSASDDQKVGCDELRNILSDHYSDGRIKVDCQPEGSLPRTMAQAVTLAVLCVEQSLPYGGGMRITTKQESWAVTGTSDRIKTREDVWAGLTGEGIVLDVAPADVQYPLLHDLLNKLGRRASFSSTVGSVSMRF